MKGFVKVSNEMLSRLIFGHDEINITGVALFESGVHGLIEFNIDGNHDIVGKENANLIVEFKTEVRIIDRKIVSL